MKLIDAEYLIDSQYIKMYMIDGVLVKVGRHRSPIVKIAGLADIVGSIVDSIKSAVQEMYDPNDPLKSLINFGMSGAVHLFGGLWGDFIYFILTECLGIDPGKFISDAARGIYELINNKPKGSETKVFEIKNIVSSALGGSSADDHVVKHSSKIIFEKTTQAFEIFRENVINQTMINKACGIKTAGPLLTILKALPSSVIGLLKNIMKPFSRGFISKIFSFIFKTFLVNLMKIKSGKFVRDTFNHGNYFSAQQISDAVSSVSRSIIKPTIKPTNPSWGNEEEGQLWSESFPLSNVENVMADWAVQRYGQLAGHQNELKDTQSFKDMIKEIKEINKRNYYPIITYIPTKLFGQPVSTKAEFVDLFVGEVIQKLNLKDQPAAK